MSSLSIRIDWSTDCVSDGTSVKLGHCGETLGSLSIWAGNQCLTAGKDRVTGEPRTHLRVAAYPFAQWLCWNWWRLLHEPARLDAREDVAWMNAHSLAGIGGGWLWPNITIASDGETIVLATWPSDPVPTEPLTHVASAEVRVPARGFEKEAERFIQNVVARLDSLGRFGTPLHEAWAEVTATRNDPEVAEYRRLEATLGYEFDRADARVVERLHADGLRFGPTAMAEIAADDPRSGQLPLTGDELLTAARERGSPFRRNEAAVSGGTDDVAKTGGVPWRRGESIARALRKREKLGDKALPNHSLAALCGVAEDAITGTAGFDHLAFSLEDETADDRIVLRSPWETARRFQVARLLADHLIGVNGDVLHPATRGRTIRQQIQRAFAAQFLCPYESLAEFLNTDTSEEAVDAAARYFRVSPRTVTTILVNKGHLPRERLPLSPG
ncbi:MAG: hypothetical protein F4Y20_11790 [Acidobacteria bacterium]|nr:hypothetical protein [Acidobacteriota bacterium]MYH22635.1 hypothetical protein [Acidobacteriota bacterium]MYK78847.1 hypothetical protein [Acidobacteriota bacterium]